MDDVLTKQLVDITDPQNFGEAAGMIHYGIKYMWRHHKKFCYVVIFIVLLALGFQTGFLTDYLGSDRINIRRVESTASPQGSNFSPFAVAYAGGTTLVVDSSWTFWKIKGDYTIVGTYNEYSWFIDVPALEHLEGIANEGQKEK